jgi:ADP-ribose pyrophosphatase YjhB (NUDIX family)
LIDVVDNVDLDGEGKVRYHYVIVDYLVQVVAGEAEADADARNRAGYPSMRLKATF